MRPARVTMVACRWRHRDAHLGQDYLDRLDGFEPIHRWTTAKHRAHWARWHYGWRQTGMDDVLPTIRRLLDTRPGDPERSELMRAIEEFRIDHPGYNGRIETVRAFPEGYEFEDLLYIEADAA